MKKRDSCHDRCETNNTTIHSSALNVDLIKYNLYNKDVQNGSFIHSDWNVHQSANRFVFSFFFFFHGIKRKRKFCSVSRSPMAGRRWGSYYHKPGIRAGEFMKIELNCSSLEKMSARERVKIFSTFLQKVSIPCKGIFFSWYIN